MPVVVEFPLRGIWTATQTPAERVPSHGTDYFGQRYAYDFARIENHKYYPASVLSHLFRNVPSSSFHCWDQPVHSCCRGVVTTAADGWPDRARVNYFVELLRSSDIAGSDYRPLAGNYIIVKSEGAYAMYGHLRQGSVLVQVGQTVAEGEVIGRVGNSGNSTMPHLHFQLMDAPDPLEAVGVPCAFQSYDLYEKECWTEVRGGIPPLLAPIRR